MEPPHNDSHMPDGNKASAGRSNGRNDHQLFLSTSTEELTSPPYASTSTLNRQVVNTRNAAQDALYANYPPSPPYRSQTSLMHPLDTKGAHYPLDEKEDSPSSQQNKGPNVHYTANSAATPAYHFEPSRPPSLAPTDDDSDPDDYNWSDEGDLEEEETKFEAKMGIKQKRKGWGFKRCATNYSLFVSSAS